MDDNEQAQEIQSPLPRLVIIASVTCLISLILSYGAFNRLVANFQDWWAGLLVYAAFPVFLTFFVLYRSRWHSEITGAPRTCSMLLLSCAILAGDIVAVGVMVCLAILFIGFFGFGFNAFSGGNH